MRDFVVVHKTSSRVLSDLKTLGFPSRFWGGGGVRIPCTLPLDPPLLEPLWIDEFEIDSNMLLCV